MIPSEYASAEAKAIYHAGYCARSIEDCPYPKTKTKRLGEVGDGSYTIWMEGYYQHQQDREIVAERQARPYCRCPIGAQATSDLDG